MSHLSKLVKEFAKRCLSEKQQESVRELGVRWDFCRRYGFQYYRMSAFKLVKGFLKNEEAIRLYELARSLPHNRPVVVEIGSWLGKSSIVLGSALLKKRAARLYCIDPFDASGDPRSEQRYRAEASSMASSIRDAFDTNIQRAGIACVVNVFHGYSYDFITTWASEIDMLLIDGDHSFEAVKRDFTDWSPFIKPGGIIAFHDTRFSSSTPGKKVTHPGPGQVVQQFVLPDPNWERVCHVHSLFVAHKVGRS